MEAAIWLVPQEVPGSKHNLKYSLFYGHKDDAGLRTVGYDNEQPKGDHRHYGDREVPYVFTTPEQLVIDFLQDVAKVRGKRPVSPTAPVTKEGENV